MAKITVIGAGNVGATVAYTLSNTNLASEIVIIDINKDKADGEAMDIVQGTAFRGPITVKSGDYPDAVGSDIVVITSGVGRKPGQTRLDLVKINVSILKSITPQIVKYAPNAKYVIVSNPVDILTYVFTKTSGIPESQIIGTGTLLDTARLRSLMSEHYKINQTNCHAFVFGEHGDSSFVPWSRAMISAVPIDDYNDQIPKALWVEDLDREYAEKFVRTSGGEVIKRKGATFYAIAESVKDLCKTLLSAYDSTKAVSTMMHGEYGIEDVCISCLTVVGPEGCKGKVEITLTDDEIVKLHHSADVLKALIKEIEL